MTTLKKTEIIEAKTQYSKFNIDDKYCAYKKTIATKSTMSTIDEEGKLIFEKKNSIKKTESSGICEIEDFNSQTSKGKDPIELKVSFFSDKQIEMYSIYGWSYLLSGGENIPFGSFKCINGELTEIVDQSPIESFNDIDGFYYSGKNSNVDFFDILENDLSLKNNIVILSSYDHTIRRLFTGDLLKKGLNMNYTSFGLSNDNYDLNKLSKVLVKRKNTILLNTEGRLTTDKIIQDIPYYNCDEEEGRTQYIACLIQLTDIEYQLIKESDTDLNNIFSLIQFIKKTDLLGFNSCLNLDNK
jgi:hypothetical protein